MVLFYVFSVFPSIAHRRFEQGSFSGTSPCLELSIFITMGLVVSSFALPIVLARAATVSQTHSLVFQREFLCFFFLVIRSFSDQIRCLLFDVGRKCGGLFNHFRFLSAIRR